MFKKNTPTDNNSIKNQPLEALVSSIGLKFDTKIDDEKIVIKSVKSDAVNKWVWRIAGFMVQTLVFCAAGFLGGLYAANNIVKPPPMMVFNLDDYTKKAISEAASRGLDPKLVADRIITESQIVFKDLRDAGIVVIDSNAVLEAPPELFIKITSPEIIAEEIKKAKPDTKNESEAKIKQLTLQLEQMKKNGNN